MKYQQKFRAPAGYKILNELARNKRATSPITRKPKHNLETDSHPHFSLGPRKSRKPVTLAKKA